MQTHLTDHQIQSLLQKLKNDLHSFGDRKSSLEYAFESAAKHIPVYLKIVKGHIEQLAKVLELETHNRRDIQNVNLAEPVLQLMQLFRELTPQDIDILEMLALESRNFSGNLPNSPSHAARNEASVVS